MSRSTGSVGSGGGVVSQVSERVENYRQAIRQAEAAGEASKVRRYKRFMTTLEQVRDFTCVKFIL